MPTVQSLRHDGYKVRVSHHRIVKVPVYSKPGSEDPLDDVLTQREYEQATEENRVPVVDSRIDDSNCIPWGINVLPHGGFTSVEVTCPDGTELHGKYNFNNRQYNRKIGVAAALGRAMKFGAEK